MRRWPILIIVVVLMLTLSWAAAYAEPAYPHEDWAGGNGWCEDGICLRAWPGSNGIEVRWAVQTAPAPRLRVMRLPTGSEATPALIGDSDDEGEFVVIDTDVVRGSLYLYILLEGSRPVGQPVEAGLATEATDPGGDGGGYKVYLPLTLAG